MRLTPVCLLMAVTLAARAAEAAAQDPSDAIYDENTVATFRLTMSPTDWQAIVNGDDVTWRRADMTWQGESVPGVGVRASGRGSLHNVDPRREKQSIRISFNEFEFANPAGPGTPGRKWRGVNKIKLDSMMGNQDQAMMRLRVGYWAFRQVNSPASRASSARLYVNGAFKGVYTAAEPVRKDFVRYRWSEDGGNLYEIPSEAPVSGAQNTYNVWRGTDPASYVPYPFEAKTNYPGGDYRDIVELVNIIHNVPADQVRSRLGGIIDMDGFLRHLACMVAVGDLDGVTPTWAPASVGSNNHFWYHRAATNRLDIIKWDVGASQGLYDASIGIPKGESPIFYKFDAVYVTRWIAGDSVASANYKNMIRQVLDGPFQQVLGRIDFIYGQIRDHVYADPLKPMSNAEFDAAKDWLKDWYVKRIAYLRSQVGSAPVTNNAAFVSQTVPSTMTAGQTYSVSVTMRNSGTSTWTAAATHHLRSQNPPANFTWGVDRATLAAGDAIAPNQSKTFTWTVTAPGSAGTYDFQWQMRQSSADEWFGPLTPNVSVSVTSGSTLTVSLPGVADTTLSQGAPTTNYGGDPTVRADGDEAGGNDLVGLLKFDLTSIPPGSSVQTVELAIVVTNPSAESYPLYEARRRWVEGEATWEWYASGQAWEVGGAGGTQDRGSAALGTITATAAGTYTLSLSAAAVQGWVDVPGTNQGIVIAHSTNGDGLGFESREAAAGNRPSLRVTYAPGPPPPDTDGDGMTDVAEVAMGFDPSNADQDGNGRPDGQDDWDGDGIANQAELGAGTPPGSAPGGTGGGSDGSEGCGATGWEGVLLLILAGLVSSDSTSRSFPRGRRGGRSAGA